MVRQNAGLMKLVVGCMLLVTCQASGFDFSGCSGGGEFTLTIADERTVTTVGSIPKSKGGVKVYLSAINDLDINLFDTGTDYTYTKKGVTYTEKKNIVGYCRTPCNRGIGALSTGAGGTETYRNMNVTYSGFNGDQQGDKGKESIEIGGITADKLIMKVFSFKTGTANVKYSWDFTDSDCCRDITKPCTGQFSQNVPEKKYTSVGIIPKDNWNVIITLNSEFDTDVQLYDIDVPFDYEAIGKTFDAEKYGSRGKAIIAFCRGRCNKGSISSATPDMKEYKGIKYKYSGYHGDQSESGRGKEYIEIKGKTNTDLEMTAYGWKPGTAPVTYSYFRQDPCPKCKSDWITAGVCYAYWARDSVGMMAKLPENCDTCADLELSECVDSEITLCQPCFQAYLNWDSNMCYINYEDIKPSVVPIAYSSPGGARRLLEETNPFAQSQARAEANEDFVARMFAMKANDFDTGLEAPGRSLLQTCPQSCKDAFKNANGCEHFYYDEADSVASIVASVSTGSCGSSFCVPGDYVGYCQTQQLTCSTCNNMFHAKGGCVALMMGPSGSTLFTSVWTDVRRYGGCPADAGCSIQSYIDFCQTGGNRLTCLQCGLVYNRLQGCEYESKGETSLAKQQKDNLPIECQSCTASQYAQVCNDDAIWPPAQFNVAQMQCICSKITKCCDRTTWDQSCVDNMPIVCQITDAPTAAPTVGCNSCHESFNNNGGCLAYINGDTSAYDAAISVYPSDCQQTCGTSSIQSYCTDLHSKCETCWTSFVANNGCAAYLTLDRDAVQTALGQNCDEIISNACKAIDPNQRCCDKCFSDFYYTGGCAAIINANAEAANSASFIPSHCEKCITQNAATTNFCRELEYNRAAKLTEKLAIVQSQPNCTLCSGHYANKKCDEISGSRYNKNN